MYRARRPIGVPPPGWDLPPGWGQPLDDPQPFRAGGPVGRWVYPTLAVSSFLTVTGFVLGHDDPAPGLSGRGLLAIALAATVVVLLTIRRTAGPGPLARALGEYTVVALLAGLLATTGITLDHPTPTGGGKQASTAIDHRPALVKTVDTWRDRLIGAWGWLAERWRRADQQTTPRPQSSATTPAATGQAMAPSPAVSPSTRRPT